jgi:hypothetical protein
MADMRRKRSLGLCSRTTVIGHEPTFTCSAGPLLGSDLLAWPLGLIQLGVGHECGTAPVGLQQDALVGELVGRDVGIEGHGHVRR